MNSAIAAIKLICPGHNRLAASYPDNLLTKTRFSTFAVQSLERTEVRFSQRTLRLCVRHLSFNTPGGEPISKRLEAFALADASGYMAGAAVLRRGPPEKSFRPA